MIEVRKVLLYLLALPLVLVIEALRGPYGAGRKLFAIILILMFISPTWWGTYNNLIQITKKPQSVWETQSDVFTVPTRGTSMLPTIKDGEIVTMKRPEKITLERSDMVSFANEQTVGLHYLKRIVAMPGEKIAIQNGNVLINGQYLNEEYTNEKLPTYGNTHILECKEYEVPTDHFAVLGDNRAVSMDSRILGFVHKDTIDGVIKAKSQAPFSQSPTVNTDALKPLSAQEFLEIVNKERSSKGSTPLKLSDKLEDIANKRSQFVKQNINDWKDNTFDINTFINEQGIRINRAHEYVTIGYLTPSQLLEQIKNNSFQSREFLDTTYTDIGIGITEHTEGICTYPVISIMLVWPSEAIHDKKIVDDWQSAIQDERNLLTDLQSWVGFPEKDQTVLRKAITITSERISIATRIHKKMTNKEFLTQEDYDLIKKYNNQYTELGKLLDVLFPS